MTQIDIREFYGDEGDEKPGKKGIALSPEQVSSKVHLILAQASNSIAVGGIETKCRNNRRNDQECQISKPLKSFPFIIHFSRRFDFALPSSFVANYTVYYTIRDNVMQVLQLQGVHRGILSYTGHGSTPS